MASPTHWRHPGVLVALMAIAGASSGAERPASKPAGAGWPQWRGPNRDGISTETGILVDWPSGGPRVLWRAPAGSGFSSTSLAGGRLYTLWDEGADQLLLSLDATSGETLWRQRIDSAFSSSWGDGPRSTPAVDDERVYAVSAGGRLGAFAASDGKPIWVHDLVSELGSRIPEYGYSSSPLIERGRLFVEVGGKEGHAFVAFEAANGEVLWTSQTDAAAYSSPIPITVGNVRQIVFLSASGLFAVAPEDGRSLWTYPWDSSCPATGIPTNVAQPVFVAPDLVFVSSGYGTKTGSEVVRVVLEKNGFRAERLWESHKMRNLFSSSVEIGGYLYGFDVGTLKCIDARTGEERWKASGFQRGSLTAVAGTLIVLGEQGRLALVEATPEGYREIASTPVLEGRSWSVPVLAAGRLYLRGEAELVSLDLTGG